jgi:hypothetical protein
MRSGSRERKRKNVRREEDGGGDTKAKGIVAFVNVSSFSFPSTHFHIHLLYEPEFESSFQR